MEVSDAIFGACSLYGLKMDSISAEAAKKIWEAFGEDKSQKSAKNAIFCNNFKNSSEEAPKVYI